MANGPRIMTSMQNERSRRSAHCRDAQMQGRGNRGGVHDLSASLAAKAHPQEEGSARERKAAAMGVGVMMMMMMFCIVHNETEEKNQ